MYLPHHPDDGGSYYIMQTAIFSFKDLPFTKSVIQGKTMQVIYKKAVFPVLTGATYFVLLRFLAVAAFSFGT
jgi:hypothetical protein